MYNFHKNISVILLLFTVYTSFAQTSEQSLYIVSNSHLDTQWNWDATTTINEYILKTMSENFSLFDKYPNFHFNFEGAIKYMWMKEYYPTQYSSLKKYIQDGRWSIAGASIDANDVMTPSAESIIRNFLYGQSYYKKEFGIDGGRDIMLPDCFGFPHSLPTLGNHCGIIGFHTQKLSWGSAYPYDNLPPLGKWRGVDGSEVYAVFKGEAYDAHESFNKDMSYDSDTQNSIASNMNNYNFPAVFRYVGPRSDRGGGLQDNNSSAGENTPYWLQTSMDSDGPVKVLMTTPTEFFEYMASCEQQAKYEVWDNELPMKQHGTGCYTSQTIMKYMNRKNELLADAAEKTSVIADWLNNLSYPKEVITDSWTRLLWHQFHDDLTGTSIPSAYTISYNDQAIVNLNLSNVLYNAAGAVIKSMDTRVNGIPVVVYNPLSIERNDIVEAKLNVENEVSNIKVFDQNGNEVLSQILDYDSANGKVSFIFHAKVPSLGYATYDIHLNEQSTLTSELSISTTALESDLYRVRINNSGDISQIHFKSVSKDLLNLPIRLATLYDGATGFPAWEIKYSDLKGNMSYVNENANVSIAENGPLRISLKVVRTKDNSEYTQYIRISHPDVNPRIECVNEINWQERSEMLKVVFPTTISNSNATYDLSIGAIERGNNNDNLHEVAGHQWADISMTNGTYGLSILNDCKYGWDKTDNRTLRLTLIHTPAEEGSYSYQKDQDTGLNKFVYALYPHVNNWDETTQWEAAKLNQPLIAFQAPKHDGLLNKTIEFASLNTNKIAIKAMKQAEDSDEIIVRVYELIGEDHQQVEINFINEIASAREVNGIEEEVGLANYNGSKLVFDINRFQPKTFAVKLKEHTEENSTDYPISSCISLDYNFDIFSTELRKNNVGNGIEYAYPSALIPNTLDVDGITFTMGNGNDGVKNSIQCLGQTIQLPTNNNAKKVYILAASTNRDGSQVEFELNNETFLRIVPYYGGEVGIWENEYNLGGMSRQENIAFTTSHRHNVSDISDDYYQFLHMYKYIFPLESGTSSMTLPIDKDLHVFAITLSDNENDDIIPISNITSIDNRVMNDDECSLKLSPTLVTASHQIGNHESGQMANDWNIGTKWCVTNYNTPYLEYSFDKPIEICHWFVMNAGNESVKSITKDFKLQALLNNNWEDVDIVTDNYMNKVHRYIQPITTDKVRLQIIQGEQNGTTTRILEFAVYGKNNEDNTTGIIKDYTQEENKKLQILYNYPNPCQYHTTLQCLIPEEIKEVTMHIYDTTGKTVEKQVYSTVSGNNELKWNIKVPAGVYLCVLSANGKQRDILQSNITKIIVNNN